MDEYKVTERDLEVARQMQAPEQVIESMEAGEWLYASDREAVRYAELAIDHMREAHGQACEARWSTVPSVLSDEVVATLVVVGGAHDGAEVEVHMSVAEPRTYTDTWGAVVHAGAYEALVREGVGEALAELPAASWDMLVWMTDVEALTDMADDIPVEQVAPLVEGSVNIYIAPSAVSTQEQLDALRAQVRASMERRNLTISYYLLVTAEEPEGSTMDAAWGQDQAKAVGDTIALRSSGYVEGGAS